jgi:uncharacterized protein YjbI with pentapeptide repeats
MNPCCVRQADGSQCRQLAAPNSDRCPWHNPAVDKRDAYAAKALAEALRLAGGDGRGTHLVGLLWPEAALAGVLLGGSDLRDAVLSGADLQGAHLQGCNLRRTHLTGADLRGADLRDADLTGCNLARADLRGTRLQGARLDNTVLVGANLTDADLSGAIISSFTWNRATRFDGVRGFGHEGPGGAEDETRPFLAPLALSGEPRDGQFAAPQHHRAHAARGGGRRCRCTRGRHHAGQRSPAAPAPGWLLPVGAGGQRHHLVAVGRPCRSEPGARRRQRQQ